MDKWIVKDTEDENNKKSAHVLKTALGLRPLTARLLASRGYDTPEKAEAFLNKKKLKFYDPYLLPDMDKAVRRIKSALEKGERICIYGDYDVDGITATTVFYKYLTSVGGHCTYFIPDRLKDGYGLSFEAVEKIAENADLIITVDTGITAIEEAKLCREKGVDLIITDHHSCRDTLPDAVAVVNPQRPDSKYPFRQLAGVGVVFKIVCALSGDDKNTAYNFADLTAMGTIADVMPLTDENRLISYIGLEKLKRTDNTGLKALMRCAGIIRPDGSQKRISGTTVGYILAPRMNAAGRIANASTAVELLLCDDPTKAQEIAEKLCEINKTRQETEKEIYEQAIEQIRTHEKGKKAFVLADENWHQGVIGVVASKITEKFAYPSILFSMDGDIAKGSGRSIKGLSLMDALEYCSDLLEEYGGHELAAGLSVRRENIDKFRDRFCEYISERIDLAKRNVFVEADCRADFSEPDLKTAFELRELEPFGLMNPQPQFLTENVFVSDITPLSDGRHIKIRFTDGQRYLNAVYFGMSTAEFCVFPGEKCDVIFSLDINEYNGNTSLQLIVKAVRPEKKVRDEEIRQAEIYRKLLTEDGPFSSDLIPDLTDFRGIFRLLKREITDDKKRFSLRALQRKAELSEHRRVSICKLLIIFDVLEENHLAEINLAKGRDCAEITLLPFDGKINLDDSELLKKLREKCGL